MDRIDIILPSAKVFVSSTKGYTIKVDVKSILRIGSAHNKRGPSDLKIVEIPKFSEFF